MTLSTAFLDELRARTVWYAVIDPSVKLLRAGREWKACCPFHNEKTPSFTVNDDKGFYHCFGCGAHGDAIRFLTDHRGMPFMDAVKELASKAGMDIPAPDPRAREQAERSASLTDLMGQIAQWYSEQLNGLNGGEAREYLKRRGIDGGRTLYNLDRAAPASRIAKRLIVVEGYMDVIALDRAGISEVVAPNGTALTEGQLERLWRLDPSPILCFDGDNAGKKAAIRAALRALPLLRPDRTLKFVELPAGKDPDDVVREGGREAIEALFASPEPLDARLWRHELDAEPLGTPEAWAGLKERLIAHAAIIAHPDLARMYREDWLDRFYKLRRPDRPQRSFTKPFKPGRWTPPAPPVREEAKSIASSGIDAPTARALILGFANFP